MTSLLAGNIALARGCFRGVSMHVTSGFSGRALRAVVLSSLIVLIAAAPSIGQQAPVQLPKPQLTGGMPLMQALAQRQTTRAFADKPLPMQTLSNLLWAAFGINRPRDVKSGLGRTAPSAMNKQEVSLYVVLADGAYVYEAEQNQLRQVVSGDVRAKVAQGAGAHAAVTIIYVADAKLDSAQVDTGFIGQNVYLFAASEGLSAWLYALHGADVAGALKLPEGMKALYGQSVGYRP
jgi:nitroreductase